MTKPLPPLHKLESVPTVLDAYTARTQACRSMVAEIERLLGEVLEALPHIDSIERERIRGRLHGLFRQVAIAPAPTETVQSAAGVALLGGPPLAVEFQPASRDGKASPFAVPRGFGGV